MNIIIHENPFIDSIFHVPTTMYKIEYDYFLRGSPSLHEHIILNSDCAEIKITVDDQEYIFNSNVVCGKFTHPPKINIVFKEKCRHLTVIRLNVYGMFKLSNVPVASLVNRISSGSIVSIDQISDLSCPQSIEWLESIFHRHEESKAFRVTREIIEYIDANFADLPANVSYAIAKRFLLSESTLLRYFKKYIGLNLSTYVLTMKRTKMIRTLCRNEYSSISVQESGYYDQSHFINDFKRLFGISLQEYFSEMKRLKRRSPDLVRLIHNCID
jgi:AraC-like DNA-binding protein